MKRDFKLPTHGGDYVVIDGALQPQPKTADHTGAETVPTQRKRAEPVAAPHRNAARGKTSKSK